ncbi:unnamed protein product [Adineta steineri]|uniref:PLD phosphodiesterase domain-containing protein n=2 Tax=Adineta steineri TaxID=433720 RepID=A0A815FWW2_9BILA|nr:unnamed protein product [Adineta steineri]
MNIPLTQEEIDEIHEQKAENIHFVSNETVTSLYASGDPSIKCPKDAVEMLFEKPAHRLRSKIKHELFDHDVTQEEMDAAAEFGRFPHRPSDLFLKIFHGVVYTAQLDPMAGCISPRLVGASGVVPLSIISTNPDIMHHYFHVISHAQKEVLFATCWWQKGGTANLVCNALRALSKRATQEKRHVVVKLMIDHFTKGNLLHAHTILPPHKWAECSIPTAEELSNISMEVNTYHRIVVGAFHCKYLVVDRKIALLNSNNIYDRPNLEMMVHYEGDIVNSFYDTYLISWQLPFQPNLVCLQEEAPVNQDFKFGVGVTTIESVTGSLKEAVAQARLRLQRNLNTEDEDDEIDPEELSPYLGDEEQQSSSSSEQTATPHHEFSSVVAKALSEKKAAHSPNTLVKASTQIATNVVGVDSSSHPPNPLTAHLNGFSESAKGTKTAADLSATELENLSTDFTPFVFHSPHKPVPIALINRLSHGAPGHRNTVNPQNVAWTSAFRYAQRSIFTQSPMFNASGVVDGVISACQRGVQVVLWLDLGYDGKKEGFGTFQGGTNDHVAKKLYKKLKEGGDGAENNLQVFWYTAKDQTHPFHFAQKKRNCHVKFMSIDDQVGIMGTGNMDTQTWCHSAETNTMIDSPLIVKEWIEALYKNQSTGQYGRIGQDGKWRDANGNLDPRGGK